MKINLESIKAQAVSNDEANKNIDPDTEAIARAHAENVLEHERQIIDDNRQHREQRKEFASKTYNLTVAWLIIVVVILIFQGCSTYEPCPQCIKFHLSDSVLIALIAGASVNIIGLLAIVIRHLFPPTGTKQPLPRHKM